MPRKRNGRSACPSKQLSTASEQNDERNKIFRNVSEIFEGRVDFEIIYLVLNESNWTAEVAIERLIYILECSPTKRSNLAEIAHDLLCSGNDESNDASANTTDVGNVEDLRGDYSDLHFNENPLSQCENELLGVSGAELTVGAHPNPDTIQTPDSLQQDYAQYIHSQYVSDICSGELEFSESPFENRPGLLSHSSKSIPENVTDDNCVSYLVSVKLDRNEIEDNITEITSSISRSSCRESYSVFNPQYAQGSSHLLSLITGKGQNSAPSDFKTEFHMSGISEKTNMCDELESEFVVENPKKEEARLEDSVKSNDETKNINILADEKELESPFHLSQSNNVAKLEMDDLSFMSTSSPLSNFEHEHEKCEISEKDTSKFEETDISKPSVKSSSDVLQSLSFNASMFVPRLSSEGTFEVMGKELGSIHCSTSDIQNNTVMPQQYNPPCLSRGVSPILRQCAPSFLVPKWTPSSPKSNKSPSTDTPPVTMSFHPPFRVHQSCAVRNIDFSRPGERILFSGKNTSTPTYGDCMYAKAIQKKADPKVWINGSSLKHKNIKNIDAEAAMVDKVKHYVDEGVKVMVILRGLPGSGKTTLAHKVKFAGLVLSSDDYFMKGNMYAFDLSKRPDAHEWNQYRAKKSLEIGTSPVVIDNTNTVRWEMKPYISLGQLYRYEIEILEPSTPWKFKSKELVRRNKHGVPLAAIEQMLERYEKNVTVESVVLLSERKQPANGLRVVEVTTSVDFSNAGDIRNCQNTCNFEKEERNPPLKKAKESGKSNRPQNIPNNKFKTLFKNPFDALQSSEGTDSTSESTDECEGIQNPKSDENSLDSNIEGSQKTEDLHNIDQHKTESKILSNKNKTIEYENWVQIIVPLNSTSETLDIDNNYKNKKLHSHDCVEQFPPQCISPIVPDISHDKMNLLPETAMCYNRSDETEAALLEEEALDFDKRSMIEDILHENFTLETEADIDKKMNEFHAFFHLMSLNEEEKSVAAGMAQRRMMTVIRLNQNKKAGSATTDLTETETVETVKPSKVKSLPNNLEKSHIEPSRFELNYFGIPVKKAIESFVPDSDAFWQCEKDQTNLPKLDNYSRDLIKKEEREVIDCADNIDTVCLLDNKTRLEQLHVTCITKMENTYKLQTPSHDIELETTIDKTSWDQPKTWRERTSGDRKRHSSSQSFTENQNPNHEHEHDVIEEIHDDMVCNISESYRDAKDVELCSKAEENMYQDMITSSTFDTSMSGVESNERTEEKLSVDTKSCNERHTLSRPILVGKMKKISSNRTKIAAQFKGPFLKEKFKEKFITEDWIFPPFEKTTVVATGFDRDKKTSITDQETSITPSDLKILDFVNKHKNATDCNGNDLKIILSSAKTICSIDQLQGMKEEQHRKKPVQHKLLVDKSTMTTDLQEVDETFLVNCFPNIAEDELKDILIQCSGDVNWAVELLLEWQYNLQLTAEEKIKFVEAMCKVQHIPVTSTRPGSSFENPFGQVACKSPECLLDLCFTVIENQRMSTRKELEGQLIESGRQRLSEIESVSTLKLHRGHSKDKSTLSTDNESSVRQSSIHDEVDMISEVFVEEENQEIDKYISVPEIVSEKDFLKVSSEALMAVKDSYSSSSEGSDLEGEILMSPTEDVCRLKVPEMLAKSLVYMFGPVGSNVDFDNIEVPLDLQTAQRLHQCWKKGLTDRKSREKQLKEDEAFAKKLQEKEQSFTWRERVTKSESPLRNVPRPPVQGFSLPDVSRPLPKQQVVLLKDIMAEEMAKQSDKETMKLALKATGDHNAIATMLKRKKLYVYFPGIDETLLDELFETNCFNLDKTIEAIQGFLGEDATDAYERQLVEATKQQSLQEMLDSYLYTPTSKKEYQAAQDPEYEDYRGEANIHHRLQHECFQKAQEAHRRNMRDVASFYSQQGHLHTQKIKDANMRASEKILAERNYDLQSNSTLDLHGLHVDESVAALEKILPRRDKEFQKGPDKRNQHLIILTGRGKHSLGGIAKLRPAVLKFLQRNCYHFEENQKGVFKVLLKNYST